EGLATYVEPVARARAGQLLPEDVWLEWLRDYPQGYGRGGSAGLDGTHDWGRTYYGGALYWLLADVETRRRSGNQLGLEHGLRAIGAQGGSILQRWSQQQLIDAL